MIIYEKSRLRQRSMVNNLFLTGTWYKVLRFGYAIKKNKHFFLHISKLNRTFAAEKYEM